MFVAANAQSLSMVRLGLATGIHQSAQLLETLSIDPQHYEAASPAILANVVTAAERLEEIGIGEQAITQRLLSPDQLSGDVAKIVGDFDLTPEPREDGMEPGWTAYHDKDNLTQLILSLLSPSVRSSLEDQTAEVSSRVYVSDELDIADALAAYLFSYFTDPASLRADLRSDDAVEEPTLISETADFENGFLLSQAPAVSDDSPVWVIDEPWTFGLSTDGFDPEAVMQAMAAQAADAMDTEQSEDFG